MNVTDYVGLWKFAQLTPSLHCLVLYKSVGENLYRLKNGFYNAFPNGYIIEKNVKKNYRMIHFVLAKNVLAHDSEDLNDGDEEMLL